jgi:hypothetical protein
LDTADSSSFNGSDSDVTLFSPAFSPGVSDDVVLYTILSSVTNSGDGVIEAGSASGGVEDTTSVSLEGRCVSLNGDGGNSLGNGSHKLGNGSRSTVGVGLDFGFGGGFVFAASVSGSVCVVSFVLFVVILHVVETVGLPSTIATVGSGIAVDEFLLGEGFKVSGFLEMVTLDGSGGRESPA